jgi:drug/metabolite transporter (DMT)-like permease
MKAKKRRTRLPMLSRYKHHLWLHFVVFLFGFTGILGKLILIDAVSLVWYRVGIASTAIFVYLFIKKLPWKLNRKGTVQTMLTGLITAAHWVCFFESIKQSNVSIALICLSATTFFISLMEPLFHRRPVRLYEVLLGLLVIAGLAFIFNVEFQYRLGLFFGLLSALLAAFFSVINSLLIRTYNAKAISLWELTGGFLGLSVYCFVFAGGVSTSVTVSEVMYLLILAIACTAFAYVVSIEVMKHITPYSVSMSINLEPVYGILLALAIFGESEQMSSGFYVGTLVILASIFLNAWKKATDAKRNKIQSQTV